MPDNTVNKSKGSGQKPLSFLDALDPELKTEMVYNRPGTGRIFADAVNFQVRVESRDNVVSDDIRTTFYSMAMQSRLIKEGPAHCSATDKCHSAITQADDRIYLSLGHGLKEGENYYSVGGWKKDGFTEEERLAVVEIANAIHRIQQLK